MGCFVVVGRTLSKVMCVVVEFVVIFTFLHSYIHSLSLDV